MIRLGITGFPLGHTKSPGLHRGFLRAARKSGTYDVLPFDPKKGKSAFFRFLETLKARGYVGVNVTIPHKEWAFEYASSRGGAESGIEGRCAKAVAAANTLLLARRKPTAANTDAGGLWSDLAAWRAFAAGAARGFDLIIVGTGGSARGALAGVLAGYPLARKAGSIRLWGRSREGVLELAGLGRQSRAVERKLKARQSASRPLLVLWCLPPVSPRAARAIWGELPVSGGKIFLYDLNYGERARTTLKFVTRSRRRTGEGMLRLQAKSAFQLWKRLFK